MILFLFLVNRPVTILGVFAIFIFWLLPGLINKPDLALMGLLPFLLSMYWYTVLLFQIYVIRADRNLEIMGHAGLKKLSPILNGYLIISGLILLSLFFIFCIAKQDPQGIMMTLCALLMVITWAGWHALEAKIAVEVLKTNQFLDKERISALYADFRKLILEALSE